MRDEARVIALAEWAARTNAATRRVAGVEVVPEECREARAYLDGLMTDEEAAACVAADLARVWEDRRNFAHISDDDRRERYGTESFAAACRAADAKRPNGTVWVELERARRLMAADITLAGAFAEVSRPTGLAARTIMAAEYLVRTGDAESLQRWLAKHSAAERTAIQKHLGRRAHARASAVKPRTD